MNAVEVDPQRRVARVGGGALWAQVDAATQEHGLATTGGRVSTTGVAGLTLGGGSGWLERKHGLACDNLLAAELVTADRELVRASATENPELLWGLRGGGGNFGVVTALELALHPVGPEVLAGLALWPADRAAELLRRFRDLMRDAPDELSLAYVHLTVPEDPDLPEAMWGEPAVAVAGMWAGEIADGERGLAEIRGFAPPAADLFGAMPYADFQCAIDDPPGSATTGPPSRRTTCPTSWSTRSSSSAPRSPPARRSCSSWRGAARWRVSPRSTRRSPGATRSSSCTRSRCGSTPPTTSARSRGRAASAG
jgi:hypothetical protein